jgi:putative heme-binding domain-containing protein
VGNWVGPDLSSIGTKYGEKELLYHILNPSGAIGDTYVPFTFALADGNVLTGLVTDEDAQRVVLKTAAGERMMIATSDIDERRPVSKSIMPENLAQAITEQQLADLVSYLASLRQPVTEVGEYFVLGPFPAGSYDATRPVALDGGSNTGGLRWKSVRTSRDQFLDLSSLLGASPGQEIAAYLSIDSPVDQEARIAVTTANAVTLAVNGKPVALSDPLKNGSNTVRDGKLTLHAGKNDLLLSVSSGEVNAGLTTTFIAEQTLRIGE